MESLILLEELWMSRLLANVNRVIELARFWLVTRLSSPHKRPGRWRWFERVMGNGFALLLMAYLGYRVYDGWQTLPGSMRRAELGSIVLGLVITLIAQGMLAINWSVLVTVVGGMIPFGTAMRIYSFSNLGRYLPGSVWHFAGRLFWLKQERVTNGRAVTCVLLEQGIIVGAGALVGAAGLLMALVDQLVLMTAIGALVTLLGCGVGLIIALTPHNVALREIRRRLGELPVHTLLIVTATSFGFWLLQGIAAYLLIGDLRLSNVSATRCLVTLTGAVASAWVVGYLAVFAPTGLGVREGVFLVLVNPLYSKPVAAASALVLRAAQVLTEMIWVAIIAVAWRRLNYLLGSTE